MVGRVRERDLIHCDQCWVFIVVVEHELAVFANRWGRFVFIVGFGLGEDKTTAVIANGLGAVFLVFFRVVQVASLIRERSLIYKNKGSLRILLHRSTRQIF